MDHDSPSPYPPPPPPSQDDGEDIVAIAYFLIFYFFVPLCILFALIYYSVRDHLWELCCYYDAEATLESQQPYHPADIRATSRPSRPVIRIPRFTHHDPPNRPPSQPQPPPPPPLPTAVGRLLRGSVATSPERISEIAASCTECAICTGPLDEEGNGEACTTLPLCGHRFHKVCVYHWLNRKATCPICRRFYPFPVRPKFKILLSRK